MIVEGGGGWSMGCSAGRGADEYCRIMIHVCVVLLYAGLREFACLVSAAVLLRHCSAIRWVMDKTTTQKHLSRRKKSSISNFRPSPPMIFHTLKRLTVGIEMCL